MARFQLIGPSYSSQSLLADCQRTVNLYPEAIESQAGKSAFALYPTPGKKLFATLPGMTQVRGFCYVQSQNRLFAVGESVAGQTLFEVSSAGVATNRGSLGSAGSMASMAYNQASPVQLLIASGGSLFLYNLGTNVLTTITTNNSGQVVGPVSQVGFTDGYFVVSIQNSNQFQLSDLLDGTTWNPVFVAQIETFPDNIVSMVVDHREIAFGGQKQSQAYYDSGNANFPFDAVPGGFLEVGSVATFGAVRADNAIMWLDGDEHGSGIARRMQGYTPQRISNHAIEYAWSKGTISDAVSFSYQDQGHTFIQWYFPTLNQTWVYDVATQLWHERTFLNPTTGTEQADRAQCHAFAFGKHLLGDYGSGAIYDSSINYLDDFGNPIRRLRRSPHVSIENQVMYHRELVLDIETGVGPQPPLRDGQGNPRGPKVSLRISKDGARTWSNYMDRDFGQAGKYKTRVRWLKLGRSRDAVFEFTCSDPVPFRIIDGYLFAEPGYAPSERLTKSMAKIA